MLVENCTECGCGYDNNHQREDGRCPKCVDGSCRYCGKPPCTGTEEDYCPAAQHDIDTLVKAVAKEAARVEKAESARDEDQEACRVVMAERDALLARLQKAESDAQAAHAGAAAMREAAADALECLEGSVGCGDVVDLLRAALSSSSGAAMLERVRVAEEGWAASRGMLDRFSRLLAACQSLHRKWRGAYRTARDYGEALENVCDSLGMKETHWMVIGSDVAAVVAERDSLRAERDAAVARLNAAGARAVESATGPDPEIERLRAEVERLKERTRAIAIALRDLSPGPHPGPMDAEEFVPLVAKRIEALEGALRQMAAGPDAEALAQADSDSEVANIWRRFGIRCWNDARALLPAPRKEFCESHPCVHGNKPIDCDLCVNTLRGDE